MANYREKYRKAVKAKGTRSITPVYREWGKDGDQVVGMFLSRTHVQGSLGVEGYFQYLFDTDEGLVKLALGKATDNEVGEAFQKGVVYVITFRGKEKIGGGRTVNKFLVEEVSSAGEVDEFGDEDAG